MCKHVPEDLRHIWVNPYTGIIEYDPLYLKRLYPEMVKSPNGLYSDWSYRGAISPVLVAYLKLSQGSSAIVCISCGEHVNE